MIEEINIRQIFSEFIHFNKRNGKTIFFFIVSSIVLVISFQKLKPSYFETKAICMSGISEYERIEQIEELSQRTAIDLINFLQINVENKDFIQLSNLLNLPLNTTKQIKSIEAEQLYQQDMNEKFYALNKFEIKLIVFDNSIISDVQTGLMNYFNNNEFISQYHKVYVEASNRLISEIDKEINNLSDIRKKGVESSLDLSSVNIVSGKNRVLSNQIISLAQLKEDISTNILLLKPLSFVQGFAKTNKTERDLLVWCILISFLSYLLSLMVCFTRELSK